MIQGLSETEFQFLNEKLLLPLKRKGAQVFLFGSRATGKYQKFSDIDLIYVDNENQPLPEYFIYSLLSEIEDSDFPYKIDLVKDQELAKSYRVNVEKQKISI